MFTQRRTELSARFVASDFYASGLKANDRSPYSRMNVRSRSIELIHLEASAETSHEAEVPVSRAERRDQQTHRVLEAAKRCFVLYGFQGASMNQICTEAGMSPGALYRYFPSKEAIVEAICEADRQQDAELFAMVVGNKDVVDGVVQGAMRHIRFVHETNAAPMFAEIAAESMRNPAVNSTCEKNMVEVQRVFHGYLRDARERGEIDPPVDLDVLVPTFLAMAHGMAVHDLPSHGIDFDELEKLLRSMIEGMLRPVASAVPSSRSPADRPRL